MASLIIVQRKSSSGQSGIGARGVGIVCVCLIPVDAQSCFWYLSLKNCLLAILFYYYYYLDLRQGFAVLSLAVLKLSVD